MYNHPPSVAKFGGTSMARPEYPVAHLENGYQPNVIVVSAPGQDLDRRDVPKMTDLLYDYDAKPHQQNGEKIARRLGEVCGRYTFSRQYQTSFVSAAMDQLEAWQQQEYPVEALGEQWSARLFAAATGRTYLDARDVITVQDGDIEQEASTAAIRRVVKPSERYVMPGFYGAAPDGEIATLARGGSDISGAMVALALESEYHNWSDVDGFYDSNPRHDPNANLIPTLTYSEAIELSRNGTELLHERAAALLSGSGLRTVMRNTFGLNEQNTVLSDEPVELALSTSDQAVSRYN